MTHPGREAYTAYLGSHWYSENVRAMFSVEHMCTMTMLVAGRSIRCVALRWSVVGRLGDVAFAVSSLDNCDSGNDDNNDDDVGDINGF